MSGATKSECILCGSRDIRTTKTNANGGHGPALLPGLSRLFRPAKLEVLLCAKCGHLTFFADEEARGNLAGSTRWHKLR